MFFEKTDDGLLFAEPYSEPSRTSKMKGFTKIFRDTHREKAPSNETPALTESTNMCIWVFGTTNQLFARGT